MKKELYSKVRKINVSSVGSWFNFKARELVKGKHLNPNNVF